MTCSFRTANSNSSSPQPCSGSGAPLRTSRRRSPTSTWAWDCSDPDSKWSRRSTSRSNCHGATPLPDDSSNATSQRRDLQLRRSWLSPLLIVLLVVVSSDVGTMAAVVNSQQAIGQGSLRNGGLAYNAAFATTSAAPSNDNSAEASPAAAKTANIAASEPSDEDQETTDSSVIVPAAYWMKVDDAIAAAAQITTPPPSFNDPAPTPAPEPFQKIYQASTIVNVVDTPEEAQNLADWDMVPTQNDPFASAASAGQAYQAPSRRGHVERSMSVVPYDMQLGARVMASLHDHPPQTPPPSQATVDESVVARCPILMFSNRLSVRAPRCGQDLGEWADPETGRSILRWRSEGQGDLRFSVDSAVSGAGSVLFANFREAFSIKHWNFELYNCIGVKRYLVQESAIKMDYMAAQAYGTGWDHDLPQDAEATFYEYTIKHSNGSVAAKTGLFRLEQDIINFTKIDASDTIGDFIAVAKRTGHWRRDQWRQCTMNPRGWDLTFNDAAKFDTAASVQDFRVVAAAVINMMAHRDEYIGTDGVQHVGQGDIYAAFFTTLLTAFLICLLIVGSLALCLTYGVDKKMRRFFGRFEQVALPKRAFRVRQGVLNPTY